MFDVVAASVPEADTGNLDVGPSSQQPTRVRVEFPETWLWSESSTGYHLIPGLMSATVV